MSEVEWVLNHLTPEERPLGSWFGSVSDDVARRAALDALERTFARLRRIEEAWRAMVNHAREDGDDPCGDCWDRLRAALEDR
jgi:hypothetical protein